MKTRYFNTFELLVVIAILFIVAGLFLPALQYAHDRVYGKNEQKANPPLIENLERPDPDASNRIIYNAWVKFTGNPKDLTLEEFKVLKNEGLLK